MFNNTFYNLGIAPSVIRALFSYGIEKAKEVGAENVFDYSIGNPSIPSPPAVNTSIHDILNDTDSIKVHGYSVASGFEITREAIAGDLNARFPGINAKASEIFITCGAAPALIATIKALSLETDTEIMTVAPFFPEYTPFVSCAGSKLVVVPPDKEHFQIDIEKLESLVSENTQGIIINSPNNPSGVVYTEDTLKSLADVLTIKSKEYGHPIYIISDEPYRELVYGDVKVPFLPTIYPNTIVCYSYSKSLSLPGERIGYIYVPECAEDHIEIYNACAGASRIMGHVCPPSLMQLMVARCAHERPDLKAYDENRTLLYNELTTMGYECVKPDGAFYMFIKAPGGDSMAFSEKAKLEQNLLIVPADGFGCPGYLRLSYCVSNDMIKRSLPAFKTLIESYK